MIRTSGKITPFFEILFLLLLNSTTFDRVHAADSPFGIPDPLPGMKPGTVILHGGGYKRRELFRTDLMKRVSETFGPGAKVLLMPSDEIVRGFVDDEVLDGGESIAEFKNRLLEPANYGGWKRAAEAFRIELDFLITDRLADPDHTEVVRQIDHAQAVWVSARDPEWLPGLFGGPSPQQPSKVITALRNLLRRGGIIAGLGGAMSSFPETVISGSKQDNDADPVEPQLTFGLGLLSGVIVDKDFSEREGRLERLTSLLRKGPHFDPGNNAPGIRPRMFAIGVSHHTEAILKADTIEAFGEGRVEVFLPSEGGKAISWYRLDGTHREHYKLVITRETRPSAIDNDSEAVQNPFGLPVDQSPNKTGSVVLHGGHSTDDMYELILERSRLIASKPRMVHCPMASDAFRPLDRNHDALIDGRLADYFYEWVALKNEGQLKSLDFIVTRRRSDARLASFVKPVTEADAMWFSGGDQSRLSQFLVSDDPDHPTLFQNAVVGIVSRGGVVGGTSAGLAMMPAIVIKPDDEYPEECELIRGFGLLDNVLADQHFDTRHGRINRLSSLLWSGMNRKRSRFNYETSDDEATMKERDRQRGANILKEAAFLSNRKIQSHIGIAVEERTALLILANRFEVKGSQNVHILLKSTGNDQSPPAMIWHTLSPGDAGTIRRNKSGFVLKLEVNSYWKASRP